MPLSVFLDTFNEHLLIYEEFFNAIKDKQGRYINKLIDDINLLQTKYALAQLAIKYMELTNERDAEVMSVLSSYLAIRPTDGLKIILTRSRKLLSDIDLKRKELERISPKADGSKVDRKYFTRLIVQVQKHFKIIIIKKEVTVAEFAEMIIDLRNEIEKSNARQS